MSDLKSHRSPNGPSGLAKNSFCCFLMCLISLALLPACQKSAKPDLKKKDTSAKANQSTNLKDGTEGTEESVENPDKTMVEQANALYEAAKASGETTANNAQEWLQGVYQKSADAGETAASSVAGWVNSLYQQAKESGTTTAKGASDWISEDFGRIGAWEYASRTVSTGENPNQVLQMLNQMGRQKWECFWVDKQADETTLYFKKSPKSYMGSIPFRDAIKLMPFLGGGDENTP